VICRAGFPLKALPTDMMRRVVISPTMPWGNLAIFYRDFRYSKGLIPLGVIESGVDKFASLRGEVSVFVEFKP
jgi:hypothetical protein